MNSSLVIIFIIELILLYLISLIIYYLFLLIRKVKINERFGIYTISKKNKETQIFDEIFELGYNFVKFISTILYKIKIFDKYSLKYQKYIKKEDKNKIDKMDFISKKVIISFVFLLIVILYDVFKYQKINFFQVILAFVFGFFTGLLNVPEPLTLEMSSIALFCCKPSR